MASDAGTGGDRSGKRRRGKGGGVTPPPGAPTGTTTFDRITFIRAVLKAMGIAKPPESTVDAFLAWMQSEGTHAAFNPFAIDGAYGAVFGHDPPHSSAFNSNNGNPVWNFGSWTQGVSATAAVIQQRFPGIYQAILGGSEGAIIGAVNSSGWGSHPSVGMGGGTDKMGIGNGTSFFPTGYTGSAGGTAGATTGPGGIPPPPGAGTAKTQNYYLGFLTNWGVAITPAVAQFAATAAANKWTSQEFEYAAYHQPWFANQFPGIFDAQGHLVMSPSQYEGEYKRYQGIANQFGQNLSRHMFGFALKNNLDATTFSNRLQADQIITTNKRDFEEFVDTLQAQGLAPKGGLKRDDLRRFVLGEGPAAWSRVWEEGYLRIASLNAGLVVGKEINRKLITSLIRQHPELAQTIQAGGSAAIQASFYKLHQDLITTAPASRLYAEGLSPQDLSQLEFGGPRAAEIAVRAQQALDNLKAQSEPQAGASLGALGTRAGGGATTTALATGVKSPFPTP